LTLADPATAPLDEGATAPLAEQHARLRAVLDTVSERVQAGRSAGARRGFRAFRQALTRHIGVEEEVLFPLFEVRVGLVGGPTALMREEHRQLLGLVERMGETLNGRPGAAEAFSEARQRFEEAFRTHAAKEERFLYTTLDRLLSEEQRAMLAERLARA